MGDVLDRLGKVIEARRQERPDGSYVVDLLDGGVEATGAKVLEEARELVDAAKNEERRRVVNEAADLFFHALVLLDLRKIGLDDVRSELERRFGSGGREEKERRTS